MSNYDIDLIKALQQNEKPFGLMSEEMQAKAKEIGVTEFSVYLNSIDGWDSNTSYHSSFDDHMAYHLRPDYEAKPEIVEYPYTTRLKDEDFRVEGYIYRDGQFHHLSDIPDGYLPSGFKYADGNVHLTSIWHNGPREMDCKHILTGAAEVLTPIAVLFKEV